MRSISFIPSLLRSLADPLTSILYPQACRTCGSGVESGSFGTTCGECWESTRFFTSDETLCEKCGTFLKDRPSQRAALCGRCESHEYDKARAVGVYEGAVRDAVLALKSDPYLPARMIGKMTDAYARSGFLAADLIVPVPLSKKRLRERGHNQAAVIGRIISNAAKTDFDGFVIERVKDTPMHRAGMDERARELTLKNAFAVRRPRLIRGRRVTLVDDVLTSGSTASACARALKKNGAAEVYVFTLGRAVQLS